MRAHSDRVSALIAGGGPVGLTVGLLLGRRGIDCLVVERRLGTSVLPRATGVNVRSMEIFRGLGLEEQIRSVSLAGDGVPFLLAGETVAGPARTRVESDQYLSAMPPGWPSPAQACWCAQDQLEPLLLAAAQACASTALRFGAELVSVTDNGDQVRAVLRDTGTGDTQMVEAAYLVGADGVHSTVREQLGIGARGQEAFASELTILFRADLEPALHGRRFFLYRIENGEVSGILRPARTSGRWLFGTPAPAGTTPGRCAELLRAAVGDPGLDVEIIATGAWQAAALVADAFIQGRVVLAGDSAHQHTPGGGFGLNMGIGDAHNLAWKLAAVLDGWAGPGLLGTYETERRPLAQLTTKLSAERLQAGVARSARILGVVLGAEYQAGAFVPDGSPPPATTDPVTDYRPCARPGHRAPHLWLDPGRTISTLDLFNTGELTLLTAEPGAWQAAATAAVDNGIPLHVQELRAPAWPGSYEVEPHGAVLVRPDGYVAARWPSAPPPAPPALAVALAGILRHR